MKTQESAHRSLKGSKALNCIRSSDCASNTKIPLIPLSRHPHNEKTRATQQNLPILTPPKPPKSAKEMQGRIISFNPQ